MKDRENNLQQGERTGGVRRTFFLGMLSYRRNNEGEMVVRPVWKNVGLWFLLVMVLFLVTSYMGLYLFFKYGRKWDMVTLGDVHLVVTDRAAFREKVGNEQFKQAKAYLEEGKIREAIMYAQQASSRAPANREARVLFAQMQVWMNRPDRAINLLYEGLNYGEYDSEYVQLLLQMMSRYEDDDGVIRLYDFLKEKESKDSEILLFMQVAAANALFNQGKFDEALQSLDNMDPRLLFQAQILRARIEWERGAQREALQRLEALRQRGGSSKGQITSLLVNYYRQMGNLQEARSLGLLRVMEAPDDNAARVDYVMTLHEVGETQAVERQLNVLMKQEMTEELRNLLMMLAIRTKNFDLGRNIHEMNVKDGMNVVESGLRFAELYIMRGEYQSALDLLDNLEQEQSELAENSQYFFHALRGIAYHGLGQRDQRDIFLNRFLEAKSLRPEHFLAVSNRLMEVGALSSANRILEHALTRLYPNNRELLTQQLRFHLRRPDEQLIGNLEKLLQLRRLSRDLTEQAYRELVKDRFLFTPGREAVLGQLEEALENYRSGV